MLDLSDGLGADLPRLAEASKLGFEIDEKAVPRERGCTLGDALTNGEDYELLFAVAPRVSEELKRRWRRRWRLGLTRIGRLTRRKVLPEKWPSGYVHFK
jgi:thiamine-monophosphate kinase